MVIPVCSEPSGDGLVVINDGHDIVVLHWSVDNWEGHDDVEGHLKHPVVVKGSALEGDGTIANVRVEVKNVDWGGVVSELIIENLSWCEGCHGIKLLVVEAEEDVKELINTVDKTGGLGVLEEGDVGIHLWKISLFKK